MKLYELLAAKVVGRSVGDWLACFAAGPLGGLGCYLVLNALYYEERTVWAGVFLIAMAQLQYYLMMGYDMDERNK